jgi:hypothetical protein
VDERGGGRELQQGFGLRRLVRLVAVRLPLAACGLGNLGGLGEAKQLPQGTQFARPLPYLGPEPLRCRDGDPSIHTRHHATARGNKGGARRENGGSGYVQAIDQVSALTQVGQRVLALPADGFHRLAERFSQILDGIRDDLNDIVPFASNKV